MTNLLVSMLDKAGVRQETLGDSTGRWRTSRRLSGFRRLAAYRKNTDANQPRYARRCSLA